MPALLDLYRGGLVVFLCVFARVGGLVVAAPVFGARGIPKWMRLALAAAVAVMITPVMWSTGMPPAGHSEPLLLVLCREAALGLVFGLALLAVFAGLQIAGRLIAQASGMGLAEGLDPDTGARTPLFGRLFDLCAVAVFLLAGGHRQVLAALLDTFAWMPPGEALLAPATVATLNQVVAQSFLLAARVAAPVVAALLAATLIVGFVHRAVPELNALVTGLSLNGILAVAVLSLSLGTAAWLFQRHVQEAIAGIRSALEVVAIH